MRRIAIISLFCAAITGAVGACMPGRDSAVVQFELGNVDGGRTAGRLEVRDFRFYLHDISLLTADARAIPLRLSPDSNWQTAVVALIDLTGPNAALRGSIDGETTSFDGISFTVGVPFDLNHANPLTAKPPLNRGELFWSWQTGYKFMRVDLADASGEWSFHLGSTGCASASAVRAPINACAQPNMMRVELRGFDPLREPVRVRLDAFAEWMSGHAPGACTGNYEQTVLCTKIHAATGLNPKSGTCQNATCDTQRFFAAD